MMKSQETINNNSGKSKLSTHKKGLLIISFTAFLWSTSGLFIRLLSTGQFQIAFYRSLIATITVTLIVLFREKKVTIEKDAISILCWISYAGLMISFIVANRLTKSANVIFLQFTAPVYLLFLEPVFLKKKFKVADLVTIVITLAGMSLFFSGKLEPGDMKGNLIAIFAGICFAFFSLFLKWKKSVHGSENTIGNIIMGNLLVAVVCFPIVFNNLSLLLTDTLILAYMGIVQIGISYYIFNEGIKYVSATESMIFATLEAVFNPIWVFAGIGEVPSPGAIIGGAVIIFAILFHSFYLSPKFDNATNQKTADIPDRQKQLPL
jgi:DME family drug/metabolite transporter